MPTYDLAELTYELSHEIGSTYTRNQLKRLKKSSQINQLSPINKSAESHSKLIS